ncbi:hypothetical protein FRC07_009512 [Ceratobasidium sp. 392]|nr:hypothetical protein FRC07_009512 [Ceratobasidium sp. 392]
MKPAEPAEGSSGEWTENSFREPEGNNLKERVENNLKEREENNLKVREENNLKEREENNLTMRKEDDSAYEGDEKVLLKRRAKLFRFESNTFEWKERGIGEVRLLQHKGTKKVRVLMRHDKTSKIRANHCITSDMILQPNITSDRTWVWKAADDISDGEAATMTLALRFASKQIADEFKLAFESIQASAIAY